MHVGTTELRANAVDMHAVDVAISTGASTIDADDMSICASDMSIVQMLLICSHEKY